MTRGSALQPSADFGREALEEVDIVGALRRAANQFVDPPGVRSDQDAPTLGLDPVEDDRRSRRCGRRSLLAKAPFAFCHDFPNLVVRHRRYLGATRSNACPRVCNLPRIHYIGISAAVDL